MDNRSGEKTCPGEAVAGRSVARHDGVGKGGGLVLASSLSIIENHTTVIAEFQGEWPISHQLVITYGTAHCFIHHVIGNVPLY